MAQLVPRQQSYKRPFLIFAATLFILAIALSVLQAQGSQLAERSLKLGNNQAGRNTTYSFSFQPTSLGLIEKVVLEVCSNDPFPGTACSAPTGFDASGAMLVSQTGDTGFALSSQTTANKIVIDRPPLASDAQQDTYAFSNVINPSAEGSYYVRVMVYQDNDESAGTIYYGGIAFVINSGVDINATVPPYLLFCVGVTVAGNNCDDVQGNYVNFGEFSSRQASQGSTQMLAATNAKDGYNVRVLGTTLTSGTYTIAQLTSPAISRPGVSQFGMNLRANNSPQGGLDVTGNGAGLPSSAYSQINLYSFNSGDVVAGSVKPDDARKYTTTYLVNVDKNQAPGVYVSTLTYIALGNF